MKFKVLNKESENLTLSAGDLFDILTSKIKINEPRVEFEKINTHFLKSLEKANIITPLLNKNLLMNTFYICFSLGYYYRLFLEKNEVELIKETENDQTNT